MFRGYIALISYLVYVRPTKVCNLNTQNQSFLVEDNFGQNGCSRHTYLRQCLLVHFFCGYLGLSVNVIIIF